MRVAVPEAKAGWVRKRSSRHALFANWSRRYVALQLGRVHYFAQQAEDGTGRDARGGRFLEGVQVVDEDGREFDLEGLCEETSRKPLKIYLMSNSGEEDLLLEVPDASLGFEWVDALQQHSLYASAHTILREEGELPVPRGASMNGGRSLSDASKPYRFVMDNERYKMRLSSWTLRLSDEDTPTSVSCAQSGVPEQEICFETVETDSNIPVILSFVTHSSFDCLCNRSEDKKKTMDESSSPSFSAGLRKRINSITGDTPVPIVSNTANHKKNGSFDDNIISTETINVDGVNMEVFSFRFEVHPKFWFARTQAQEVNPYPRSDPLPPSANPFLLFQVLVTNDTLKIISSTLDSAEYVERVSALYLDIRQTIQASHSICCANNYTVFDAKNNQSNWRKLILDGDMSYRCPKFDVPFVFSSVDGNNRLATLENVERNKLMICTCVPSVLRQIKVLQPESGVRLSIIGTISSVSQGLKDVNANLIINVLSHAQCNDIENARKIKVSDGDSSFNSNNNEHKCAEIFELMKFINEECNSAVMLLGEDDYRFHSTQNSHSWKFAILTSNNIISLLKSTTSTSDGDAENQQNIIHSLAMTIIGGRISKALSRYASLHLAPDFEVSLHENISDEVKPFKIIQYSDILLCTSEAQSTSNMDEKQSDRGANINPQWVFSEREFLSSV